MRKIKFTFIKYLTLALACGSVIAICGCSGTTDLKTFFDGTLLSAIKTRGEHNKEYAAQFQAIGAISNDEFNKVCQQIDTQVQKYVGEMTMENGNWVSHSDYQQLYNNIGPAVSSYRVFSISGLHSAGVQTLHVTDDDGGRALNYNGTGGGGTTPAYVYNGNLATVACTQSAGADKKDPDSIANLHLSSFSAGNYIAASRFPSSDTANNQRWIPDKPNSIEFFTDLSKSNSIAHKLNESVHAQIYVLKPNIMEASGSNSIDGVIELVNQATNQSKNASEQVGMLNNYFIPAYEEHGGRAYPIYLIDGENAYGGAADGAEDYNIIITSRTNDEKLNRLGYDMIVDQDFGDADGGGAQVVEDMIRIRFTEFNEDALDKLTELTNSEAYFLAKDPNSGWKAYYMVYPVEVITAMSDNGDGTVDVHTEPSGLGINLKTGKYVKYKGTDQLYGSNIGDDGKFKSEQFDYTNYVDVPNSENYYLKLNSTQNNNTDGIAPLVINGFATDYELKQVLPNSKHESEAPKVVTARIVLSDYLEGTFAPGFVENETIVAFGRKLRLRMGNDYWHENTADPIEWYTPAGTEHRNNTQLIYSKTESDGIAYYVDIEGNHIETLQNIKITDFAHITELTGSAPHKMKTLRPIEIKENATVKGTGESEETATNIDKVYTDGTIKPTLMFPGKYVANIDYKNDTDDKQRMYVIVTRFGLFDNALFSNWINSQSQTASLLWWNQYLSDNSFQYDVGQEHILNYLQDKYAYELSQSGIVILDLDTVAKIQKQYDEEENYKRTSWIRTFFMLLGWFVVVYSAVLMIAWVIDANLDIGVKLLEKLTLGNWVAVKYEEDIPYKNTNDQTFLDSKKMFIRAAIMIAIGIFLINVNIFNVVLVLIDIFGRAAAKIEDVIQGLK